MSENKQFSVLESFSSIQGEGLNIGKFTFFVRLAGCNLDCLWCDTKWIMGRKPEQVSFDELKAEIMDSQIKNVCFTGGEPLLQHKKLFSFIDGEFLRNNFNFTVETNGTITLESIPRFVHFTISPKLLSSFGQFKSNNELLDSEYSPDKIMKNWLKKGDNDIEFKFVIDSDDDLDLFISLYKKYSNHNKGLRNIINIPVILQPAWLKDTSIHEYLMQASKLQQDLLLSEGLILDNIRILIQLHRLMKVR